MDRVDIMVLVLGVFSIILLLYFLTVFGNDTSQRYLTSFSAGVLGVLLGFLLNRKVDKQKDNRVKKDFLKLIYEELTKIKGQLHPPKEIYILYTDIWDSMVSSGLIRLLNSDQVSKLSRLYKAIKGTSYEAEWVRRNYEELCTIPDIDFAKKLATQDNAVLNRDRQYERMKGLNQDIDNVLKEKWWNS